MDGVVDRWQDLGPVVWVVAAGLAVAWFVALGLVAAALDPRRVAPGPATLDLPGDEPPAVVALLAGDWDVRHEAMAATVLDMAARRRLSIDSVGERTVLRVRPRTGAGAAPTPYEDGVVDLVAGLARATADGVVPVEAMSLGAPAQATPRWKAFRRQVTEDARARGLSRPRWSAGVKSAFVVAAAVVAAAAALAASTVPDDPDDPDDSPLGGAAGAAVVAFGGLGAVVTSRSGERDTPAGRAAAARWLGVRDMLADNPMFADQPPAAVAIWDRHLAYGAALGVAPGAVRPFPLAAESDTRAWSAESGRWRLVKVRYPRGLNPLAGGRPASRIVAAVALLATGVLLVATLGGSGAGDGPFLVVAAVGAAALVTALADLTSARRVVTGRVLRYRVRQRDDDRQVWFLAVDDGSQDRIRAWRLGHDPPVRQGDRVRLEVTPLFRIVRLVERVGTERADQPACS
jgi:Predicted membrane protein (DUF2207)